MNEESRMTDLRETINDPALAGRERLAALQAFCAAGPLNRAEARGEVNNHVHTIYSFSPYSPAMAALRACESGLDAVGSVDHDSIGAARETLEAGRLIGIATTVGFELRTSFRGSRFESRRINYPECLGKAYMVIHGVPATAIDRVEAFLAPLRAIRVERTRQMTKALGKVFSAAGIAPLDFDRDVAPRTKLAENGGITERHLLAAAARRILYHSTRGPELIAFLEKGLGIQVPAKLAGVLSDPANPHALYDLIGLLKTTLLDQVFIQPGEDECVPVRQAVDFARSVNAIPAYAYLGDVGESPTGDKKAETFEDAYLDELMVELKSIGFQAVTYMPPRNTLAQLLRVQKLCAAHGFLEISGVDINSSRQSFNCPEILRPEFRHLNDSTWALIAHEKLAARQPELAFFHPDNPLAGLSLASRIAAYAASGRAMDPRRPEALARPVAPKQGV
jgi:hypothetical protein